MAAAGKENHADPNPVPDKSRNVIDRFCPRFNPPNISWKFVHNFFTSGVVANYANAGIATGEMRFVRPSVCHTLVLYQNEQRHDFFTDGMRRDSSFCRYQVHPKIWKGVMVCAVFFTVLTAPKWLSSSVTVMTIFSENFSIIRIMFCVNYFQNNQVMTITWDLDLMTAHWVLKLVIVQPYSR